MAPRLAWFGRRRRERELDEEIAAHLAMAEADRRAAGQTPSEAAAGARRDFGSEELVREATRAQWGLGGLERFLQDVRYGARLLRRSPAFSAVAILTLALGIGANTAILSVVEAILLKPLGYADPERLVVLLHRGYNPVAPANFFDWKAQTRSFESMGAAELWSANLTSGNDPEKLTGLRMTPEIFPMLGISPRLGRFFGASETRERVVLLSYGLWQRRFGGDPAILGRTLTLNGEPFTVIGVMPPDFVFPPFWASEAEMWTPLDLSAKTSNREGQSLRIFARRRRGVSLEAARRDVAVVTAALEREFPGTNRDVRVIALQEKVVGDVRLALLVLLGAVGLVLLIACANVANMLLARASARHREIALRAALGASRGRTIRQLLTESLLLGFAGGLAGAALGAAMLRLLVSAAPAWMPRISDARLDPSVLAATFLLALLCGAAFGLAPALQSSRLNLQPALKEGASTGTRLESARLRRLFVAAEVALAIVLLVGSGLMIRSFVALRAADPGFDPRGVLSLEVSVTGTAHAEPGRRAILYREILERFRTLPGVRSAGAINHIPIDGDIWGFPYLVEGRPLPRPGEAPTATYRAVLPGYFATMRLPILRGRDVAPTDTLGAPGVVLVNEFLARHTWPGEDPIGKRLSFDGPDDHPIWVTVIGVVRDAFRGEWGQAPEDEAYLSFLQRSQLLESTGPQAAYITYVVRTDGDPTALAPSLRSAVRSIDRTLPVSAIQSMTRVVDEATASSRFQAFLLAAFAASAALLAAVGIYGVMSYAVSQRTREIGVRLAVGADPGAIRRMVVGQGMTMAAAGAAAGLVSALALTRLMGTLLYGVRPGDPATYVAVTLALLGVALAASWLPALRASRVDPMRALRGE